MTPCLKIWGPLANLEGQNFFMYNNLLFVYACVYIKVFEECRVLHQVECLGVLGTQL